jgi:hypothetical protein
MEKIPAIDLTKEELDYIVTNVNNITTSILDARIKTLIISILNLYYQLMQKLQSAQITIHKLKMLCGFKSDKSKKAKQIQ